MIVGETARIALRAIHANPVRSSLTMLGIVIGIAAMITMVSIGSGARMQVAEQIRSLGSDLLLVQPGSVNEGGVRLGSGSRATLTQDDAAAIAVEASSIVVAAPALAGQGHVVYGNRNWSALIGGVTPDYLVARDWRVDRGRSFRGAEVETAAKVALLGSRVARELFADTDAVGKVIRIGTVPFEVIGVLADKGQADASGRDQDDVVLLPITSARLRVIGGSGVDRLAVHFILVKTTPLAQAAAAREEIIALLRQRHRLPAAAEPDFQVRIPAAALEAHAEATRSLSFLLATMAVVALVVGGISIMNIMLVSVAERTREIGLRRALGARKRDIKDQFLIEAVLLCLFGGLAGIVVGIGVAIALAKLAGWPVFISPMAVSIAIGVAVGVGVIFGLYPAVKASSLDPLDALRLE